MIPTLLAPALMAAFFLASPLPASGDDDRVAIISEARGLVRIKERGSPNWIDAGKSRLLHEGELIFTGTNSTARILYVTQGATVTLPSYTIYQVDRMPRGFTKLRRRFGAEKGLGSTLGSRRDTGPSKKKSSAPTAFERLAVRPGSDTGKKRDDQPKKGSEGEEIITLPDMSSAIDDTLRVSRDTEGLTIEFPSGETTVAATSFPTTFTVRLALEHRGHRVWGYLWRRGAGTEPVWSGFGEDAFARIPLRETGEYTFQAISEDDTRVSPPMQIHVVRSFRKAIEALAKNPRQGGTVVVP